MSWNTFHNRGEILRAVVDAANDRCDGVLPTDVPGVAKNFADDLDLVGALQLKWHARLSGNLERAFLLEPMDLESAVVSAWQETAGQLRGVRLVMDECDARPTSPEMERAVRRATHLERARLATAAGLASGQGDAAAAVGARIEARAREAFVATRAVPAPAPRTTSLADRIKAALAA